MTDDARYLADRHAVVTGGGQGIGAAIASELARLGASVTLTANVTPSGATGLITFYDGTTVLGDASLGSGQATLKSVFLAAGARSLHAYYAGSAIYAASTSPTATEAVNAIAGTGFVLF